MTTVLVTGATDGIGRQTVHELVGRGARVIVHGRDRGRVDDVVASVGSAATGVVADYTELAAVRSMAAELADRGVDVLINNAGVYASQRSTTPDGHELTWQVNHLAGALLTDLLLDPIAERHGRVIFVAAAMYAKASLDLADPDYTGRPFNGQQAYGQSKLASVMYMSELVRRLGPSAPLTVNALHPGVVSTKLMDAAFGAVPQDTLEQGAASIVHLALDDDVAESTGGFFIRDKQRAITGPAADSAFSRKLYDLTCQQVAVPGLPAS